MAKMKRFQTHTEFGILELDGNTLVHVRDDTGEAVTYKTRQGAENYCSKGEGLFYVERKFMFYK